MIRTLDAEWHRLSRRGVWLPGAGITAACVLVSVAITFALADPGPARGEELTTGALAGADGAARAVTAGAGFTTLVILVMFVSSAAGEFSRGTWRVALLHQPDPWRLATGKYLALLGILVMLAAGGLVGGVAVGAALAPAQDIAIDAWFGADGWLAVGWAFLRLLAFATGWALLGTTIGLLARSIPVGLAIALVWFGPLENAIGMRVDAVGAWFPGLLLRAALTGHSPVVSTERVAVTLACYAAACVVAVGVALRRRSVTS